MTCNRRWASNIPESIGFLPSPNESSAEAQIAGFRAYLDHHPQPRPVLEWAIRWLAAHVPPPLAPVLCHRDFRTGNYMVDGTRLTGILDWEFAGWGDPDEDIGWFCCKGWRFARLDREAGGIAERAQFYPGYESAAGRRLDPDRIRFWEIFANVRWAIIALQQSDRYLIGGARDLSTAVIGRRAGECELELLMLLDNNGPPAPARIELGRHADETPIPGPVTTARFPSRSAAYASGAENAKAPAPSSGSGAVISSRRMSAPSLCTSPAKIWRVSTLSRRVVSQPGRVTPKAVCAAIAISLPRRSLADGGRIEGSGFRVQGSAKTSS